MLRFGERVVSRILKQCPKPTLKCAALGAKLNSRRIIRFTLAKLFVISFRTVQFHLVKGKGSHV